MNLSESNINERFFVILADDLRLVFFSKFNKFVIKHIIKELKIDNYIKQNNVNNKVLDNYNFKISKCMVENNTNIYIVEIEISNRSILGQVLATAIENENIEENEDNGAEYTNIINQMESLKDKLNMLMENNYKNNYKKVLEVSVQLDNVINEYWKNVNGTK